jgi:hypothetical protein
MAFKYQSLQRIFLGLSSQVRESLHSSVVLENLRFSVYQKIGSLFGNLCDSIYGRRTLEETSFRSRI